MLGVLTIGKVAALTGVTPDTIRYYERLGLLQKPARTTSNYRVYPKEVVNRLRLVRNAQRFGFSLREISGFVRTRDAGRRPCEDVRGAAQRMLASVEQQITDLVSTRTRMKAVLRDWDETLARTPQGQQARLLDTLDAAVGRLPTSARRLSRRRDRSSA